MKTRVIHPGSDAYPDAMALIALAGRPRLATASLYLRGRLPDRRGICIVGSRDSDEAARDFTLALATRLAREGWAIWSGGAEGIDTAAHFGALDGAGPSVAVLGGGHDHPFPRCNGPLFEEIARSGATMSLVPDHVKPARHRFPERNLLLTGLTAATVVVQANPRPSGAMHAATVARRLGKTVFTAPQAPWNPGGRGSLTLLEEGATPFHSADELVARLAALRSPWPLPAPTSVYARSAAPPIELPLGDDDRAVLAELTADPAHVEQLCERTGRPYLSLNASLVALVLAGAADEPAPGFFCRAPERNGTTSD